MNNDLAVIYLSIFVGLLFIAVISVFREIFKSRKLEGSFSKLRSKLKKEPGSVGEYYQLGSIYSQKKLFTQAVSLFQKAIKSAEALEERDTEVEDYITLTYNGLGYAYFAQEQYDLAIRNYKEALKRQPEYVTALNNLAHDLDLYFGYRSLTKMMKTLAEYFETGAYYLREDGFLDWDKEKMEPIFHKYNPGLSFLNN